MNRHLRQTISEIVNKIVNKTAKQIVNKTRSKEFAAIGLLMLAGCGADSTSDAIVTETVQPRAWHEEIIADGEIKAAASTPLSVPGEGWDKRNLVSMIANGSLVEKGQLIAKFDAAETRVQLSQSEIDLVRKELAELGIQAQSDLGRAELNSESSKVDTDLSLSKRYANADLKIFAQNSILDKLVDIGFLSDKQTYLNWKRNQLGFRQQAEEAVVGSQKESVNLKINQQRKSLSSLELVAPHQGVFILKARWDGTIPQVGSKLWAGDEFGSLPDLEQQVAKFSIPEGATFGLKEGQSVKARLAGTGTELDLHVTSVGKTASTKSRESPVKYTDFEAKIDHDLIKKYGLKPGQALSGKVNLFNAQNVLTVPNIALVQDGADYFVYVQHGATRDKKKIELGLRGPVRSEVKTGLAAGEQVLLIPENKSQKDAQDAKDKDDSKSAEQEKKKVGKA
jgi:multidrug efflux pump subunit AcrA (membrane-fusion protein)